MLTAADCCRRTKSSTAARHLVLYTAVSLALLAAFVYGLAVRLAWGRRHQRADTAAHLRLTVLVVNASREARAAAAAPRGICSRCGARDVCLKTEADVWPRCLAAKDLADPTGCGGLCALERQQCRLLDARLGIRACLQVRTGRGLPPLCPPGHVACRRSPLCVPAARRCDGFINCPDLSDEQDCACDLSAGEFRCGQELSCVRASQRCDGSVDCWDASDERGCSYSTCSECLAEAAFCDGVHDCPDGSDEPPGCSRQPPHNNVHQ